MKQQAYIVVGPSRSGTSLAMGILSSLGVYVGNKFRRGNFNPCYYEDIGLHNLIMSGKGTPEDVVCCLAIRTKWGMKLPALAFAWDRFSHLIPNPKFIVTHRNLDSNVNSIYNREVKIARMNLTREDIRRDIQKHYDAIDEFAVSRIDVDFDAWFDLDNQQLVRVAEFVGLPITQEAQQLPQIKYKHF